MSPSPSPTRPLQVWKDLPPDLREKAALAFFADDQSVAEKAEVIGLIARRINFRTRSVLAMPDDRRWRWERTPNGARAGKRSASG